MLTAIYGGAFDPVHLGHLAVARAARDELDADVALIPTGDPPHRAAAQASAGDRLAMLELAISGEPRLRVDRHELDRAGRSYSVDTLMHWRNAVGAEASLAMIVGQDSFASLPTWHRWRELFELAHIVVAGRAESRAMPSVLQQHLAGRECAHPRLLHATPAGHVLELQLALHPHSSSEIRTRCAAGKSLVGWVPEAVADYITTHRVYVPV